MAIEVQATETNEAGEVTARWTGPLLEAVVPLLAQLTPDQAKRAMADADALRQHKLMPSVREEFQKLPPRGEIGPAGG